MTKTQLRRMQRQAKQARENTKAERLLITKGSDSAIKAVYQANREAKARGALGYHPDQKTLEGEAPFNESDLEYLRHYFSVTPADDDLLLETSDGEYEEILRTIEAEGEAGRRTQGEVEFTINMVLVLPSEFSAPGGQVGGLDDDVAEEQLG
ncbi:unnamed protein product [Prunus brigantina]